MTTLTIILVALIVLVSVILYAFRRAEIRSVKCRASFWRIMALDLDIRSHKKDRGGG